MPVIFCRLLLLLSNMALITGQHRTEQYMLLGIQMQEESNGPGQWRWHGGKKSTQAICGRQVPTFNSHDLIHSARKPLKWDYTERRLYKGGSSFTLLWGVWNEFRVRRLRVNLSFYFGNKSYFSDLCNIFKWARVDYGEVLFMRATDQFLHMKNSCLGMKNSLLFEEEHETLVAFTSANRISLDL